MLQDYWSVEFEHERYYGRPEKSILVVEDEEDILALLHFNLIKAGYNADCASHGEEALALVAEKILI